MAINPDVTNALTVVAGIVGIIAALIILLALWAQTRKPGSLFGEQVPESSSLRVLTSIGDVAMWIVGAVVAVLALVVGLEGGADGNGNGNGSDKARRTCAYCGATAAHDSKVCACGRVLPSHRDDERGDDSADGVTRLKL